MSGQVEFHPVIIFLINMAFSAVMFFIYRLIMGSLYKRVFYRWHFLSSRVEHLAQNCSPLIKKYGVLGLVIFVALPFPGTGVFGGAIVSWFLGLRWHISFLAVIPASAASTVITTAGIVGLLQFVG